MNIFVDYKKKIILILKKLEKKNIIKIPTNLNGIVVELPPKNEEADISCNAALIISKINNKSPSDIAQILKKHFFLTFKEFEGIYIAGPGFLNIRFKISFWKKNLSYIINQNTKYGSFRDKKKKI